MTYILRSADLNCGQYSMVKIVVIGRFFSSVIASCYFTRRFTSVRPAGSAFILWVHAAGSKLLFY